MHLMIDSLYIGREPDLTWILYDLIGKSTLVQVIDGCYQATSCYLNKCWSGSMMPFGVSRGAMNKRIEAETNWLPFYDIHFLVWKLLYFDSEFTEICFQDSI